LALVIGAGLAHRPSVAVSLGLSRDRVIEGDKVGVEITLEAEAPVGHLEILLRLPEGLELDDGRPVTTTALTAAGPRRLRRSVRCRYWGGYHLGALIIRARDPLGLFVFEQSVDRRQALRVYPRPEPLRTLVRPAETQLFAGNERARSKGEGIEFADVRPFLPGDRVRRINWRLSSRRTELYVNDYHHERNTDVVLFLDTFAEARRLGATTHHQAVRAAAALAEHYLRRRDRVGLVGFGGILCWLQPQMGAVQRYRIVESLIDTDVVFSYAWKEIRVIPRAMLPPKALVIAVTPLLDDRTVAALLDLHARRFDLAIVEISPIDFTVVPPGETGAIAHRIWRLDREVVRHGFQRLGIPVAAWHVGRPLEPTLQEVQAFHRFARHARV
jgi:uncharacterized protein (DUF58 family)